MRHRLQHWVAAFISHCHRRAKACTQEPILHDLARKLPTARHPLLMCRGLFARRPIAVICGVTWLPICECLCWYAVTDVQYLQWQMHGAH